MNSTVRGPQGFSVSDLLSLHPHSCISPWPVSLKCPAWSCRRVSVLAISSAQKVFPILTWFALHSSVAPSKALSWPPCLKHYPFHPPLSLHVSLPDLRVCVSLFIVCFTIRMESLWDQVSLLSAPSLASGTYSSPFPRALYPTVSVTWSQPSPETLHGKFQK